MDLQHSGLIEVVLGTLMAVSDGMTYGWTSPMIPYFQSNQTHIQVTDEQCEWMETVLLFGAACGLPFTILGVNYLGRKKCMLISAAVGGICWTVILLGKSVAVILTARFFSGLAGDMCFVAAPMYIAEIADHRIRGFLSAMIYLMMLVGMLIVYSVGSLAPYMYVPIVGMVLTSIQVIFFPFMPESPYYLIYINKKEEARKSLLRLRGAAADITEEIAEIEKAIVRQKNENFKAKDLVLVQSNRHALLIMVILNCTQHFAGISVVFMNLHVILNEAGSVYLKPSTAAIIFAVILLVAASTASAIIDKFGRKFLLIISGGLTGVVLLVIAVYFHMKNLQYDVVSVSWIPAASVMVYAATFKLGLGLVPIVVTAEIFPTSIKAIGMTIADVVYVIASIISLVIYSSLYKNYGMHVPFYLFGGCSFLAIVFVYLCVPETKGKTLDEIQLMLKGIKPEDYEKQYGTIKASSEVEAML